MVGLYHKRKAQRSQAQSKVLYWIFKSLVFGGCFIVGAFVFVVFFFNGERIKQPLSEYLSEHTGLQVEIENADFSVIYPDVIKLNNIKFGQSLVKELYLEYDLTSIFNDQEFVINDLYINGMTLDRNDLKQIKDSPLGFQSIRANLLRLNHIPLKTKEIATKDATLRLNNVVYNNVDGLTFSKGSLAANDATFFNEQSSSLSIDFQQSEQGIQFNSFNINMWGGVISGSGRYIVNEVESKSSLFEADLDEKSTPNTSALANVQPVVHQEQINFAEHEAKGYLQLDELNLSKIIIKNDLATPGNLEVHSKKTTLSQVIFAMNSELFKQDKKEDTELIDKIAALEDSRQESINKSKDAKPDQISIKAMVAQGIDGSIDNLVLKDRTLTGKFVGSIDDFTLPGILTTITKNTGSIDFKEDEYALDLNGNLYEGKYQLKAQVNSKLNVINIESLDLQNNKIGLHKQHLKFLQDKVDHYQITFDEFKFNKIEFLSYLNEFPVSVQEINGLGSALVFSALDQTIPSKINTDKPLNDEHPKKEVISSNDTTKEKHNSNLDFLPFKVTGRPNGVLNLQFKNALYSNLLFKNGSVDFNLNKQYATINIPKLDFKESSLSATASLSLDPTKGQSSLVMQAQDFETADLNSNLINHLLTGKIDFNLNLKSEHQSLADLVANLKGSFKLKSESLLISDFGLDLINGGKKQNYNLTQNELLSSMQGSVAGISKLNLNFDIDNGIAKGSGQMGLATANTQFNTTIDLNQKNITGQANFQSLARDSYSQVKVSGNLSEPNYQITALTRGELRPGLYLPQYESGAKAKKPSDTTLRRVGVFAKYPVKSNVQIPEQSTTAKDKLKEQDSSSTKEQTLNNQTKDPAIVVKTQDDLKPADLQETTNSKTQVDVKEQVETKETTKAESSEQKQGDQSKDTEQPNQTVATTDPQSQQEQTSEGAQEAQDSKDTKEENPEKEVADELKDKQEITDTKEQSEQTTSSNQSLDPATETQEPKTEVDPVANAQRDKDKVSEQEAQEQNQESNLQPEQANKDNRTQSNSQQDVSKNQDNQSQESTTQSQNPDPSLKQEDSDSTKPNVEDKASTQAQEATEKTQEIVDQASDNKQELTENQTETQETSAENNTSDSPTQKELDQVDQIEEQLLKEAAIDSIIAPIDHKEEEDIF